MATVTRSPTQAPTAESKQSALWDTLSAIRFKLSDSVTVSPVTYRGSEYHLLHSTFTQQQFRVNQLTHRILNRMNGRQTLAQILASLGDRVERSSATQQAIMNALLRLQAAGMVISDTPQRPDAIVARHREQRRRKYRGRLLRMLSPRFALCDPDKWLVRLQPMALWLFSLPAALLWGSIVMLAGSLALTQWDAMSLYAAQRFDDPKQWWLLAMVYPLIKTLHELGHCLAAHRYGASVNEMGITLLVFIPVPYVNASDASRFADKRQRMLVSAAGIMVEALLASLALLVWLVSDDGVLRDLSFAVMIVGGISTILFNGNPLLRFDGYFILSDAIEIPDLATRSSRYWGYLCKRYLLGVGACGYADGQDGERIWFLFYGALSTVYRLVLSLGIALFLFHKVPVLGTLAACWLVGLQLILPLLKHGRFLLFDHLLDGRRVSALGRFLTGLLCLIVVVCLPVFPSSTLVYGVVQIPGKSIIRAQVDGFLTRRHVQDGQVVKPGDVIYELENSELTTDVTILESRIEELEANRDVHTAINRVSYDIHNKHLAEARTRLLQLKQKQSALVVRSSAAGSLQLFHSEDYLGRYVSQGDEVAWLSDAEKTVIRVVASQREAHRIRNDTNKIQVKFINRSDAVYPGYLLDEVPLASDDLPSAALGSRAGGSISVDARDPLGVKSLHRIFTFDVQVPASRSGDFIGSRAMVRFHHQPAAWLTRWYEALKRRLDGQTNL